MKLIILLYLFLLRVFFTSEPFVSRIVDVFKSLRKKIEIMIYSSEDSYSQPLFNKALAHPIALRQRLPTNEF